MSQVDLTKMINILYSNPPTKPNSYKLDLSVDDVEMTDEVLKELAKTTSNVLMNIFISGCDILFGSNVTPSNIKQEQFELINKYINSFGYNTNFKYTYNDKKVPVNLDIFFTVLNETDETDETETEENETK